MIGTDERATDSANSWTASLCHACCSCMTTQTLHLHGPPSAMCMWPGEFDALPFSQPLIQGTFVFRKHRSVQDRKGLVALPAFDGVITLQEGRILRQVWVDPHSKRKNSQAWTTLRGSVSARYKPDPQFSPAKTVNKALNKANVLQESCVQGMGKVHSLSEPTFQGHLWSRGDIWLLCFSARNGYTVLQGNVPNVVVSMRLITLQQINEDLKDRGSLICYWVMW